MKIDSFLHSELKNIFNSQRHHIHFFILLSFLLTINIIIKDYFRSFQFHNNYDLPFWPYLASTTPFGPMIKPYKHVPNLSFTVNDPDIYLCGKN